VSASDLQRKEKEDAEVEEGVRQIRHGRVYEQRRREAALAVDNEGKRKCAHQEEGNPRIGR
jgi:predicted transcriptional regulator